MYCYEAAIFVFTTFSLSLTFLNKIKVKFCFDHEIIASVANGDPLVVLPMHKSPKRDQDDLLQRAVANFPHKNSSQRIFSSNDFLPQMDFVFETL